MVNTTQIFQNASSLNGPIQQFIESIVDCVQEGETQITADENCPNAEFPSYYRRYPIYPLGLCVPECLSKKYCGSATTYSQCTTKQKLFIDISALIITVVRARYDAQQSS